MCTPPPPRLADLPVVRLFDSPSPGEKSDSSSSGGDPMRDLNSDTDSPGCAFGHDAAMMADVSTDSASTDTSGSWGNVQYTPACYHFMCDDD